MRPPPLRTSPSGKILTHPKYLPITYIGVKFNLLSSINVWLTEIYLYNRFYIERSPKMGFWSDFGGRGEDIWWESTSVLRITRFQTSLVQIWRAVQLHSVWIIGYTAGPKKTLKFQSTSKCIQNLLIIWTPHVQWISRWHSILVRH